MPSSERSYFAQGDVNKGNAGKGGRNKIGGMKKIMTRSTVRTRNAKNETKNDIRRLIARRLKQTKSMMTRAQVVPVVA